MVKKAWAGFLQMLFAVACVYAAFMMMMILLLFLQKQNLKTTWVVV